MKKTINLFFDEAPYWQVIVVLFVLFSVFIFSFISLFSITEHFSINLSLIIKLSLTLGLIFGFIGGSLTYIGRKSMLFWEESKKLCCKIDDAKTKETLDEIFNNGFQELKKMSFGTPHYEELRRLYTIMKTKYKYLK
jgi:hypothetical protein